MMSATEASVAGEETQVSVGTSPAQAPQEPTTSTVPSQVEVALEFWTKFDLNGRRSTLDEQGLAIADREEKSMASRKQLSADTRNFRKSMADGAQISSKEMGPMLRAYQTEIDSLTNRAKAAESAFIGLYKALYDAPDPVEGLLSAAKDAHSIVQLKEEIAGLQDERGGLFERTAAAAAYEQQALELEARLKAANQRAAEDAKAVVEEKEAQWMEAQQKAIEGYELHEQELMHQIRTANESARRSQTAVDEMQHQLNEVRSQLEQHRSAQVSVSNLAAEDIERTRAEANSLRRRCAQLENRLAGLPEDSEVNLGDNTAVGQSALSAELAARDVEVSQLKDQVAALEEVLGGKDQDKRNEFAKLTSAITVKDAELSELRQKIDELPTLEEYEKMGKQLETLQSFQLLESETSTMSGENDSREPGETDSAHSARPPESLEKRLLNKMKALEGRLTNMRVDLVDREKRISDVQSTLQKYEDQISDQKALIAKLEEGINAITGDKSGVQSLKRRAFVASRAEESTPSTATGANEEELDNESAWDWGERHQAEGLENIIREEPSMLDIVSGQRDRFRSRTLELEDDNRKLMERIEKITSDADSLKNDNVRLYEKLRFVQSYKQANGNLSTSSNTGGVEIPMGGVDDAESGTLIGKYKSMYEDMVNPYTVFNRRERHKRMGEMSVPERLTVRAGQKALSTKTSRLIAFFYVIALHVLVALVLTFSNTVCETDTITTKAKH